MKRWLLFSLAILATSLSAAEAPAEIPAFVRKGLVVSYSGTVDNLTTQNNIPSSQEITVTTKNLTSNSVVGATVVTNYLSGPPQPGANNVVTIGSTAPESWTCDENKACTLSSPLGVISQFWLDPSNPTGSIIGPSNAKYDKLLSCPPEVVDKTLTCLQSIGPTASNGVSTYILLLAFDATGLIRYSDQRFQPQGTLGGDVGQLKYTFQSMLPPQQSEIYDFNGDGKADILWRNDNGDVVLWISNPGSAVAFSVLDLHGVSLDWHIQEVGDFNGDGKADILWRNDNGDVVLWISNPSSAVSFSVLDLHGVSLDWHIQRVGDFNGDGKADILWRKDNGDVLLWTSNPGSAVSFSVLDLHGVSLDWHIQEVGDFNRDGKADILWRNNNGDVLLWLSNPGSAVSFSVQDLHGVTADWHIEQIGDFNGDGKADILWRNDNGDVLLWISNPGSAVAFSVQDLHGVSLDWQIQKVGDFNDDGKADILWRNNNGDVLLWISNPGSAVTFSVQDFHRVSSDWHIEPIGTP
jgi:hypothetical protein